MNMVTRIHTLDDAISIAHNANAFCERMNSTILLQAMDKL